MNPFNRALKSQQFQAMHDLDRRFPLLEYRPAINDRHSRLLADIIRAEIRESVREWEQQTSVLDFGLKNAAINNQPHVARYFRYRCYDADMDFIGRAWDIFASLVEQWMAFDKNGGC
jgi:hypothetical protein